MATKAGPPNAGSRKTALIMSTLALAACFMVWTVFSIVGVRIQRELGLNETQFGLLVGMPVLTGALSRLPLGILADRIGGRIVYTAVMLFAAAATWMMAGASSYEALLVGALGLGLSGGSFAVGTSYVSRWHSRAQQGTALGLFGMGNIGTSLTHFLAPATMVAFGWPGVLQIWAVTLAAVAIAFWFLTKDDPVTVARRRGGMPAATFASQIAPIRRLQVWRFSTYYFFTFGAYVALSLWLPRYYMGVYGLDIAAAGLLGAAFSVPGSAFRAFGGWLSDRIGARRVMYTTFSACIAITFFLSYPPTDYVVHGIEGDIRFGLRMGLVPFVLLTVLLGFFMSLGNAAVYKHIPAYYPETVGSVGGLVGMIGALGGFVLPIWFGALNDFTNLWTSCFMLLFALVCIALVWMHVAIIIMDRRTIPAVREPRDLPELEAVGKPGSRGAMAEGD